MTTETLARVLAPTATEISEVSEPEEVDPALREALRSLGYTTE